MILNIHDEGNHSNAMLSYQNINNLSDDLASSKYLSLAFLTGVVDMCEGIVNGENIAVKKARVNFLRECILNDKTFAGKAEEKFLCDNKGIVAEQDSLKIYHISMINDIFALLI